MRNKITPFIFTILGLFLLKLGMDKTINQSTDYKEAPKRFTASGKVSLR